LVSATIRIGTSGRPCRIEFGSNVLVRQGEVEGGQAVGGGEQALHAVLAFVLQFGAEVE